MDDEYDFQPDPEIKAQLMAEVEVGHAAEEFWRSEIGRYLIGCAEQDLRAARDHLEDLRLPDKQRIAVQIKAAGIRYFVNWLTEAINRSSMASHSLIQSEEAGDYDDID